MAYDDHDYEDHEDDDEGVMKEVVKKKKKKKKKKGGDYKRHWSQTKSDKKYDISMA